MTIPPPLNIRLNLQRHGEEGSVLRQLACWAKNILISPSIPFSFKAKEAGKQKIQFRILFEDIYGVKWEVTKNIELNVQEKQLEIKENEKNRGFNTLIAIIFAFLTVVGLFIAYKYFRKRETSKSVSQ